MGQKTNPIGNRLGIIRGWDSNWYGGTKFAEKVVEDEKIRRYLSARIEKGAIAKIVIERDLKSIIVTIHTSRPGIIIGKGGAEVDQIREELKKLTQKKEFKDVTKKNGQVIRQQVISQSEIVININEVRKPELSAVIVGETIAKQVEARINYRKAIKMAIQSSMRVGAEGIKVRISGRLNGADMAREEEFKEGRSPLHTFRADIDYAVSEALTVYGKLGIKVWICRGEIYERVDFSAQGINAAGKDNNRGGGGRDNRGGGNDNRGGGRDNRGGGRDNRGGGTDNRGGGTDNRGGGTDNRGGGGGRDNRSGGADKKKRGS
jgi:small subunit ribosomal protein S3